MQMITGIGGKSIDRFAVKQKPHHGDAEAEKTKLTREVTSVCQPKQMHFPVPDLYGTMAFRSVNSKESW
jgi:hypothetical protein